MTYNINKHKIDLEKKRVKEEEKAAKLAERVKIKTEKILNFLKDNRGKGFTAKEINRKLSINDFYGYEPNTENILESSSYVDYVVKTKFIFYDYYYYHYKY